jgi:hypothetical protein
LVVLTGAILLSGGALFGATLKPGGANSTTIQPPGGPAADGPGFGGYQAIRDLRTDFVRTWHVFADTVNDAILDPGDTRVGAFKNWWTPVSAATQHGHEIGAPPVVGAPALPLPPDYPSTPIDHQNNYTTNATIGLPQKAGAIGFYLTYSHMDNANFDTEFYSDGTPHDTFQQRNRERNGYAMGWLTGETEVDGSGNVKYGTKTGNVKMDIFIHNGKSRNGGGVDDNHNFGTNTSGVDLYYGTGPGAVLSVPAGGAYSTISQSEPQVVQSNEMSLLARQNDNLMLVADYRDEFTITNPTNANGFTYGPNPMGYVYTGLNGGKYMVDDDGIAAPASPTVLASVTEFNTVIGSMDIREVNSYETAPGANDDLGGGITPIHATDTPQALLDAGVTDGLGGGDLYFYEDSFFNRDGFSNVGSTWVEGSTDGGVIAGLSGFDEYSQYYPGGSNPDPSKLLTHWGEQQVIRIDFDQATFDMLAVNGISEIIFYDWGDPDPVTGQQTQPTTPAQQIVINVDAGKNLYFENDGIPGLSAGDILFPENRIYIAQVEHAPEPATMIVLAGGASALLARRRRRRRKQTAAL